MTAISNPRATYYHRTMNTENLIVQDLIVKECDAIKNMLLEKNRKYGNSMFKPKRIFSKADDLEQINVRIDDKLSRIMSGQVDDDEDVELDLIGYLIGKRVKLAMMIHDTLSSAGVNSSPKLEGGGVWKLTVT